MLASVEENSRTAVEHRADVGWLKQQRACVSPKSRPNEKIGYIAHLWGGLQLHLAECRIETDSNNVEDLIRTVALDRNTALFAGDDRGAASLGRITSLIETGELKSTKPNDWLKATHDAITGGLMNSRLDEFLR